MTIVVNDVNLGTRRGDAATQRPAKVSDTVRGENFVLSGADSRAEMRFPDESLVRVGQNTVFSFQEGSRSMSLQKGAALFYMPKGSGAATFKTPTLTAAITGSAASVFASKGPPVREGIGSAEPGGTIYVEGKLVPPGYMYLRTFNSDGTYTDEVVKYDPTTGELYNMGPLPFVFTLETEGNQFSVPDLDELNRRFELFERANNDPLTPPKKKEAKPTPTPSPTPSPTPYYYYYGL